MAQQRKSKPDWLKYTFRETSYPHSNYITSYMAQPLNNYGETEKLYQKQEQLLKTAITESVYTEIRALKQLTITNAFADGQAVTVEKMHHSSVSQSHINIPGITIEHYLDTKENILYSLAYVVRKDLINYYRQLQNNLSQRIENDLSKVKQIQGDVDKISLLKMVNKINAMVLEYEHTCTILDALTSQTTLLSTYRRDLDLLRDFCMNNNAASAKQAAQSLALQILDQKDFNSSKVYVVPMYYSNTPYCSAFSGEMQQELIHSMVQTGLFSVVIERTTLADYILSGNYYHNNETITIEVSLLDTRLKNIVCVASAEIPANNVKDFIPEDLDLITARDSLMSSHHSQNTTMDFSVWTNRGNESPVFYAGDTMRLFVQAGQQCHIRVLYYFADGSCTLLMDDFQIRDTAINKLMLLPQEFQCIEPFGAERCLVVAQTNPFEPLTINNQSGVLYVDDPYGEGLQRTRGMKIIKPQDVKKEQIIAITTLPKI
ncbi:MAG: hypothetical protein EOL98_12825 [Negativicutes bacterium]|nr:hypothetical protein [Negativicutes bacterium]